MAQLHNEIRRAGALQSAYLNALGMEDGVLERLSETLGPVIDLWRMPEWAFLRKERLWSVNPSQSAVVAEFAQVGVRNPAGSGMVVVVDQIIPHNLATALSAHEIRIDATNTVDATATPNVRDTRVSVLTGLRTVSFANSAAARLGSLIGELFVTGTSQGGGETVWTAPIVLSPGFDLYVGPDVTNQGVRVTLIGRERQAFPGELD